MSFCKIPKKVFFRRYADIAYLYNQVTQNEVVLDKCGAIFAAELKKEPEEISAIAERIVSRFLDGNLSEVTSDLVDLLNKLKADGFVLIADSQEDIKAMEPRFSYADVNDVSVEDAIADNEYMPTSEFLRQHFSRCPELFSAQIELTSFCNLRCIHCYLDDEHPKGGMSTETIFDLLDQLRNMGTLKVAFSGGEALSRRDLNEILCRARKNDFCITLLTNATLLTEHMVDCFVEHDVALVQVSLYSMLPDVHDSITGKPGSWKETTENIGMLAARNIQVQIACPVMKENLSSFVTVMSWGAERGFRVKPDILLMAKSDFSTSNLIHRLDLDESKRAIVDILGVDAGYQQSLKYRDILSKPLRASDPICGIGTSIVCVSSNGDLYPCSGLEIRLGNLYESPVADIWRDSPEISRLRDVTKSSYPQCMACQSAEYCSMCPAKFFNESGGDMFHLSEHFCGVAAVHKLVAEHYISKSGRDYAD